MLGKEIRVTDRWALVPVMIHLLGSSCWKGCMVKNYKEVFSSSRKQYFTTPRTWGGEIAALGSGIHVLIPKLGGGTFSMYLYKIKGSLSNILDSVGLEI